MYYLRIKVWFVMCFSFPGASALSEILLAYLSPYKTGFSFNYLRGDITVSYTHLTLPTNSRV